MSTTTNLVRPMGFWELFATALKILRQKMWLLVVVNLIPVLFLFAGNMVISMQPRSYTGPVLLLVGYLLQIFSVSIMLLIASNLTLGRPVKLKNLLRQAASGALFSKLIAVFFLLSIPVGVLVVVFLVLVAAMADSIPALCSLTIVLVLAFLFLISVTWLTSCVTVLEKGSAFETFKRAWKLTFSSYWRIFFSLLIVLVIPQILLALVLLPGVLTDNLILILLLMVVYFFVSALAISFQNLVIVLLYYEIRARKENYNETLLAEEMGYETVGEMI